MKKELNLNDVVENECNKLKEECSSITKVVFELNSLMMEMPFIDKINKVVMENFVEKNRKIYDNASDFFNQSLEIDYILKQNGVQKYVKQLNIYLNALSVLMYCLNNFIVSYTNKFNEDNDIEAIYNYYLFIANKVSQFTDNHNEFITNLGEEYYS